MTRPGIGTTRHSVSGWTPSHIPIVSKMIKRPVFDFRVFTYIVICIGQANLIIFFWYVEVTQKHP